MLTGGLWEKPPVDAREFVLAPCSSHCRGSPDYWIWTLCTCPGMLLPSYLLCKARTLRLTTQRVCFVKRGRATAHLHVPAQAWPQRLSNPPALRLSLRLPCLSTEPMRQPACKPSHENPKSFTTLQMLTGTKNLMLGIDLFKFEGSTAPEPLSLGLHAHKVEIHRRTCEIACAWVSSW